MSRSSYVRTDDVRRKQSESIKKTLLKRSQEDIDRMLAKRRETLSSKGIKTGRPKTLIAVTKVCEHCSKPFEATSSYAIRKAKFCNNHCYTASKKGIRPNICMDILTAPRPYRPRYHMRKSDTNVYRQYRNLVARLSERVYVDNIDVINPERHPRTLCGVEGGWQLDHIHPLRKCFDEGWSAEQASALSNLQLLPWKENLMKSDNSGNV